MVGDNDILKINAEAKAEGLIKTSKAEGSIFETQITALSQHYENLIEKLKTNANVTWSET